MLYLIYGNDRERGRVRFQALREKLSAHGENVFAVGEGTVSRDLLGELAATRGLFGGISLIVLDGILEKKAEQELVAAQAQVLAQSPNHFLIIEPSLGKEVANELARHAKEAIDCSIKKVESRTEFNIFSLGDALGQRNKKEFWVEYQRAVLAGLEPEEICNTLFWAVKNMALMKKISAGNAPDLNPFVAKKAREFSKNYTVDEIADLSRALVTLYHEAHRGGELMDVAIEKFILRLN